MLRRQTGRATRCKLAGQGRQGRSMIVLQYRRICAGRRLTQRNAPTEVVANVQHATRHTTYNAQNPTAVADSPIEVVDNERNHHVQKEHIRCTWRPRYRRWNGFTVRSEQCGMGRTPAALRGKEAAALSAVGRQRINLGTAQSLRVITDSAAAVNSCRRAALPQCSATQAGACSECAWGSVAVSAWGCWGAEGEGSL